MPIKRILSQNRAAPPVGEHFFPLLSRISQGVTSPLFSFFSTFMNLSDSRFARGSFVLFQFTLLSRAEFSTFYGNPVYRFLCPLFFTGNHSSLNPFRLALWANVVEKTLFARSVHAGLAKEKIVKINLHDICALRSCGHWSANFQRGKYQQGTKCSDCQFQNEKHNPNNENP